MPFLILLDGTLGSVMTNHDCPPDSEKRYRFTPSVSKWRMPVALSVDALCGFGAKNFTFFAGYTGCGRHARASRARFTCFSARASGNTGTEMVRPQR